MNATIFNSEQYSQMNPIILSPEKSYWMNPNYNPNPLHDIIIKHKFKDTSFTKIYMKSYYYSLKCLKDENTIRNFLYSDVANYFYKHMVDAKRLIMLLSHIEYLKKVWLQIHPAKKLHNSKIILDPDEIDKKENEVQKFRGGFLKLKKRNKI